MKVSIIIPASNEASTMGDVIQRLLAVDLPEIEEERESKALTSDHKSSLPKDEGNQD